MKLFATAIFLISQSALALNLECVEVTQATSNPYALEVHVAAQKMIEGQEVNLVGFLPINVVKYLGCYSVLSETNLYSEEPATIMKLSAEETGEFCVYNNRGIRPATYGWVCRKPLL